MGVTGALARWRLLRRLCVVVAGSHGTLEVAEAPARARLLRRLRALELMGAGNVLI